MRLPGYAMRHITRRHKRWGDSGWWIRMYPNTPEYVEQHFRDSQHGGKKGALAEAKCFRDWLEESWPIPEGYVWTPHQFGFQRRIKVHPDAGITGVTFAEYHTVKTHHKRGRTYRYPAHIVEWRARWMENGKVRMKRFSVQKYGYDTALALAKAHRLSMEKKIVSGEIGNIAD